MIETIQYNQKYYPKFQSTGFAARFAFPFAQEVCKGVGMDIGYNRPEWKLPGAFGVDENRMCNTTGQEFGNIKCSAMELPMSISPKDTYWDYIFSSHCLEHLPNWVDALDYWLSVLKTRRSGHDGFAATPGGVLFLYLPAYSQEYWRPWNNRKHKHVLDPTVIRDYLDSKLCHHIFVSGIDLNDSFMVIAEK